MTRRKHRRSTKAKVKQKKVVQSRRKKDKQLMWNYLGLLLTIVTGFLIPFYFQYQGNISQSLVQNTLLTIEVQQSILVTQITKNITRIYILNLPLFGIIPFYHH